MIYFLNILFISRKKIDVKYLKTLCASVNSCEKQPIWGITTTWIVKIVINLNWNFLFLWLWRLNNKETNKKIMTDLLLCRDLLLDFPETWKLKLVLWKIEVVRRLVVKSLKNTYEGVYLIVQLTITPLDGYIRWFLSMEILLSFYLQSVSETW